MSPPFGKIGSCPRIQRTLHGEGQKSQAFLADINTTEVLFGQFEFVPSVFRPSSFSVARVCRLLFTIADGAHPVRRDPEGIEILHGSFGPSVTKSHIVFIGAPLIAVAFDSHFVLSISAEKLALFLQHRLRFRLDI